MDVTFSMKVNMSLCVKTYFFNKFGNFQEYLQAFCSSAASRNFIPLVFHILAQAFVQQTCSYNEMGTHRYNTTVFYGCC